MLSIFVSATTSRFPFKHIIIFANFIRYSYRSESPHFIAKYEKRSTKNGDKFENSTFCVSFSFFPWSVDFYLLTFLKVEVFLQIDLSPRETALKY